MSDPFLLFTVGGRRLAVPVGRVEGVLEPARVTPMPFVPAWIDGLIVARGVVHAQIDLHAWLTGERHTPARYDLLQFNTPEGPSAAKVDRVLSLAHATLRPAASPHFQGLLDIDGEEIAVIDPDRFNFSDITDETPTPSGPTELFEAPKAEQAAEVTTELTVAVATLGETFALPIDCVHEVIEVTSVKSLPLAPPALVGLISLRDCVLPLVSLAELLGGTETHEGARAVVVEVGGRRIALLVERIVGLERAGALEDHPLLDQWQGLLGCWMGAQGRVIGLVQLDSLLDHTKRDELASFLPSDKGRTAEHPPEPRRLLMTFSVAGRLCAVDAIDVERVVEWQPPGAVPEGSYGIDGVVQVLSDVLPVVDVAGRLGLPVPPTDARAFLVARLGDALAALAVGPPGHITAVPLSDFHPLGDDRHGMVDAVARINGDLAWVLSLKALDLRVPA